MPSYRRPTHKELAKSRDPRIAQALLVQHENYVNLLRQQRDRAKKTELLLDGLRQATALLGDTNLQSSGVIDQLIQTSLQDMNRLRQLSKGRVVSRKRPQNSFRVTHAVFT